MTKRTTYIARDGKEFSDTNELTAEFDCMKYELQLDVNESTLMMYKHRNKKIPKEYMISDDTYNSVTKIVIRNDGDLKVLRKIQDFCGYCLYEAITGIGIWRYNAIGEKFFKAV